MKVKKKDTGMKAPPLSWTDSPTTPELYTGPYPITY
eukprot:gene38736-54453_t